MSPPELRICYNWCYNPHQPKSIISLRIHSWSCIFWAFEQIHHYSITRGLTHEIHAQVQSLTWPAIRAIFPSCPLLAPLQFLIHHLAIGACQGRGQEVVSAPPSDWLSYCSGLSTISINSHIFLLLYRIRVVLLPCKFFAFLLSLPQSLTTTDHFAISTVLPFSECHMVGLRQYITFLDWFLSLSNIIQHEWETKEILEAWMCKRESLMWYGWEWELEKFESRPFILFQ